MIICKYYIDRFSLEISNICILLIIHPGQQLRHFGGSLSFKICFWIYFSRDNIREVGSDSESPRTRVLPCRATISQGKKYILFINMKIIKIISKHLHVVSHPPIKFRPAEICFWIHFSRDSIREVGSDSETPRSRVHPCRGPISQS